MLPTPESAAREQSWPRRYCACTATRHGLFFLRYLLFVIVAAWLTSPSSVAASSRVVADDVLARSSAAAVHGRVVALESSWDGVADTIYTHVTLDVVHAWGLPGSPARIVVKQLGGVVNDVAFVVGGQARFEVGEEVMLFLDVRPRDRTLSVAGLESGKWTLTAEGDEQRAMAREIRGTDPQTVVAREFRSLAQLYDLAALAGSRASAAGAMLTPRADPTAGIGRGPPAFTLLSPGTPARWHEADTSQAVYVDTQSRRPPAVRGRRPRPVGPRRLDVGRRKARFGCSRAARAGRAASTTASRATAGSPSPTAIPAGRSPTRAGRWRSAAPTTRRATSAASTASTTGRSSRG